MPAWTTTPRTAVFQGVINLPLITVISGYAAPGGLSWRFSQGNLWPAVCLSNNGGALNSTPDNGGADVFSISGVTSIRLGTSIDNTYVQPNTQPNWWNGRLTGIIATWQGASLFTGNTTFSFYDINAPLGANISRSDMPTLPLLADGANDSPTPWQWSNAGFFSSLGVGRSYSHGGSDTNFSAVFAQPGTHGVTNKLDVITGTPLAGFDFFGCIPAPLSGDPNFDWLASGQAASAFIASMTTDWATAFQAYTMTWDDATVDAAMKAGVAWPETTCCTRGWLSYPGSSLTKNGNTYTRYGVLTSRDGLRWWLINAFPLDAASSDAWFNGDGNATMQITPDGLFWFQALNRSASKVFGSFGAGSLSGIAIPIFPPVTLPNKTLLLDEGF